MKIVRAYKGTIEITRDLYLTLEDVRSKDETRYFLCPVFLEDNENLLATDGKRLFQYKISQEEQIVLNENNIEDGYYMPAKIKNKFILIPDATQGQYPSWRKVVPDESALVHRMEDVTITGKTDQDSRLYFNIFIYAKSAINIDYFKVMKNWNESCNLFTADVANKAIVFSSNSFKYIVMPMQFDDNMGIDPEYIPNLLGI